MGLFSKWKGTALGALAAPLTGGLSLIGGYMYDTNKQQNKANQKAVDRANAYDMYTWDLANQYNDPKAQMERLKAAGLNPNLVYGSGNVTGNTTGQAGSNGIAQQEVFNGVSKGLQFAQATANLQNTVANNKLLQHQMEKTDADRLYTQAQTTNLRNYLSGRRSTYDSWYSRPAEYGAGVLRQGGDIIDGIVERSTAHTRALSDSAWNKMMNKARDEYDLRMNAKKGKFKIF